MPSHVSHRLPPELLGGLAGQHRPDAIPARDVALTSPGRSAAAIDQRSAGSLHVSKLRGISLEARSKLKRQGISYACQLLERAGLAAERARLAARTGIAEAELLRLARRADLARIKGVGAIFADMLELIGIHDVGALAERDPAALHAQLSELNATERFARRAPTPDEVADWIRQARASTRLLDGEER